MHGKLLIENSRHCSLQSAKEWWCGKGEYFETRGTFAIHKIQRMYFFKYCTMYMVYLSGLLLIIYCILHVSGVGREQLLTPAASNFLMLLRPQFVIHKVPVHKGSFQKRFSGIRPLRGGGVPPFSAKEKNLLFFRLIFR